MSGVFGVTCAILRDWDPLKRADYVAEVEALKAAFEASKGGRLQYYFRLQWDRPTCRFMDAPKDLQLGTKLTVQTLLRGCCYTVSPSMCARLTLARLYFSSLVL